MINPKDRDYLKEVENEYDLDDNLNEELSNGKGDDENE